MYLSSSKLKYLNWSKELTLNTLWLKHPGYPEKAEKPSHLFRCAGEPDQMN